MASQLDRHLLRHQLALPPSLRHCKTRCHCHQFHACSTRPRRNTTLFQTANDRFDLVSFLHIQRRCGFIHDHKFRSKGRHVCDGHAWPQLKQTRSKRAAVRSYGSERRATKYESPIMQRMNAEYVFHILVISTINSIYGWRIPKLYILPPLNPLAATKNGFRIFHPQIC